ncbi:hypothetical protein PV10_03090 [Exophiala mesophila]|uniref:Life-span regulatory factor domain-containing protein n=1 Tax=Exophiala mesophila TaxID=212818 RepID=A0A0D1ZLE0_EXOME|nr:uncharacterized protein PV10_03090 [Exophiala mesophila]KIV95432.1 hypothetical protein PV10_03090 [Exophiala mesophila]
MGEPTTYTTTHTKAPSPLDGPAAAKPPTNIKRSSRPRPLLQRKTKSLLSGNSGDSPRLASGSAGSVVSSESVSRHGDRDKGKGKDDNSKAMAASFLQYCAMCEKQIMTPSNSILYCSAACRRKDSAKPLSASLACLSPPRVHSMPSSPLSCTRIPADLHDHKPDLDPTEWKPKLHDRQHSEAFRYLSRFSQSIKGGEGASATTTMSIPNHTHHHHEYVKQLHDRDNTSTMSTTSTGSMTMTITGSMTTPIPSLGTTPTTTMTTSTTSSFNSMYDFNLRPLQPRQNPMYYSASAGAHKGIDLVTPHVAPPLPLAGTSPDGAASMPTTYDHDFWGKKVVIRQRDKPSLASDGLGSLFGQGK